MDTYEELLKELGAIPRKRMLYGEWLPELPVDGGKPSPGTKADRRLKENKPKPAPKPPAQPTKKG